MRCDFDADRIADSILYGKNDLRRRIENLERAVLYLVAHRQSGDPKRCLAAVEAITQDVKEADLHLDFIDDQAKRRAERDAAFLANMGRKRDG